MSRDLRVKKYRSVLVAILAFSLAVQPAFAAGNGAMVTGWFTDPADGYRYYLDPASGAMAVGQRVIGGVKYHFNEQPSGTSGWYYDPAAWKWNYQASGVVPMGALIR